TTAPVQNFVIQGNDIGTDITGNVAIGNGGNGVTISGTSGNTIGGTTSGAGNVISGNTSFGLLVDGAASSGNVLANNHVGTGAGGSGTILNGSGALAITNGASVRVAGAFTGDVLNQGVLGTANGPAIVTIVGNYTQSSAATLNVGIAGPVPG